MAQDLLDTLIANKDSCVGMAANMIGVRKRIIVFDNEGTYMTSSILKSSKNQSLIIQRKVVILCSAVPAYANAIKQSKFSGKLPNYKHASKPLPVGPRKLSNMKLTIAMEF